MKQGDPKVRFEAGERALEPVRQHFRVADERLHFRLAEITAVGPAKAATESFGPGDAHANPVEIERGSLAFQHPYLRGLQDPPDLVITAGEAVMVAEHGNHRDRQTPQL